MTFIVRTNWIHRYRKGTRGRFLQNAVTKLRVAQNAGNFIDYPRNSWLLQKESARWNYGVKECVYI